MQTIGGLRKHLREHGVVTATVVEGKEEVGAKFRDYFDYAEPIRTVPSHRALAVFRGRTLEFLDAKLVIDMVPAAAVPTSTGRPAPAVSLVHMAQRRRRPSDSGRADSGRGGGWGPEGRRVRQRRYHEKIFIF